MKTRKRLTRQESREETRTRIIEAAERVFARRGFDAASVEEISEVAGYTRGAFYSNFTAKEELLLAVIDKRRPRLLSALDAIFQQTGEPLEQLAAFRKWFSEQWRLKEFIALRAEFGRRAMMDRSVRKHLVEILRQDLDACTTCVRRCLMASDSTPADPPEVVALVLLAVVHGLGSLAIDNESEWEHLYTAAARLAFDRISEPFISHLE